MNLKRIPISRAKMKVILLLIRFLTIVNIYKLPQKNSNLIHYNTIKSNSFSLWIWLTSLLFGIFGEFPRFTSGLAWRFESFLKKSAFSACLYDFLDFNLFSLVLTNLIHSDFSFSLKHLATHVSIGIQLIMQYFIFFPPESSMNIVISNRGL